MMYPLKIAAIDRKQGTLWDKQWHTVNIVNVLDGADLGTIRGSMSSYSETSLWIVHSSVTNAVITARAVAKEKDNIFVLEVNASGLEDKGNDAPRCYKSRIPFPSNQPLAHLEPSLKRLCESLKKALEQNSNNDVAIKQAWCEFDRSAFPETLTAAYLLMVAQKKTGVHFGVLTVEQWHQAGIEYRENGGDKDIDWSNASEWDKEKIVKVTTKISDLFSQVVSPAMILTPWNIACDANNLRGQLKHSWLENEVLYISIETVINLWRQGGADLATRYAMRVQDLSRLADSFADGFSPAQLVDTLKPFGELTAEMKSALKDAVHEAYLESSGILALQESLEAAAMNIEAALQNLSSAWGLPIQSQNKSKVSKAWEGVCEKASTLVMELERLPKGVMLP